MTFSSWKKEIGLEFADGPYSSKAVSDVARMIFEYPQIDLKKFYRKDNAPKTFSKYLAAVVEGIDYTSHVADMHHLIHAHSLVDKFLNNNDLPAIGVSLIGIHSRKYGSPLDPYYFSQEKKNDPNFFKKNKEKLKITEPLLDQSNQYKPDFVELCINSIATLLSTLATTRVDLDKKIKNAKLTKKIDYDSEVVKMLSCITQTFYGQSSLTLVDEILNWHRIYTCRTDLDEKTLERLRPSLRTLQRKNSKKRQKKVRR